MEPERHNPLDDWLTLPEAVVESRQDMLPSESHGWGLNLVLAMPRQMAYAFVRTQLAIAGFMHESPAAGSGLFRFVRDDAYVWGAGTDAGEGRSRVLLSCNTAALDETNED